MPLFGEDSLTKPPVGKLISSTFTLSRDVSQRFFENPRTAEVLNMYPVPILKLVSALWHISTDVDFCVSIIFHYHPSGWMESSFKKKAEFYMENDGIPEKFVVWEIPVNPSTKSCEEITSSTKIFPRFPLLHCVSPLLGLWWDSLDLREARSTSGVSWELGFFPNFSFTKRVLEPKTNEFRWPPTKRGLVPMIFLWKKGWWLQVNQLS